MLLVHPSNRSHTLRCTQDAALQLEALNAALHALLEDDATAADRFDKSVREDEAGRCAVAPEAAAALMTMARQQLGSHLRVVHSGGHQVSLLTCVWERAVWVGLVCTPRKA